MIQLNKIYNEDCIETMSKMSNNSVDNILTSPPYNTMRTSAKDLGYDIYEDEIDNKNYIEWSLQIFNEFNRILKKNSVVIYNLSYGSENTTLMNLLVSEIILKTKFTLSDIIVWKKKSALPNNTSHNKLTRIVEFIYIFCRKNEVFTYNANKKVTKENNKKQKYYENIFNFIETKNNDGVNDLNKATFSTELVRKLLKIYCLPNSIIYDPFMGTGTTGVGCFLENHNFIGSEISKKQCGFSSERLKPFINQLKLF